MGANLKSFIDVSGRLSTWPSKKQLKEEALAYIGTKFGFGRFYTEKEVNAVISEWHTFGDYFLIRRGLVESKILARTTNGAKYWKADILPSSIDINETRLRNINAEDKKAIMDINAGCADYVAYQGSEFTENDADELINKTALPPKGFSEFFHAKLILYSSTPAGYFSYYLGYPNGRTAYIAALFIKKESRRKGIGETVVNEFSLKAKAAGIDELRAGVMTENAPGFAFWHKQGFIQTGAITPQGDGKKAEELMRKL